MMVLLEKYKYYLKKIRGLSDKTVSSYITGLNVVNSFLLKDEFPIKSVYEAKTIDDLWRISLFLRTNDEFIKKDKTGHGMYSAAFKHFYAFANDVNNSTDDSFFSTKKVPIAHKDIIINYFDSIKNLYPELVFTNHDATDKIQRRCAYIYPKGFPRKGNVIFEIWFNVNKTNFTLFSKKNYLTSEELSQSEKRIGIGSVNSRAVIELSFFYKEEFVAYFKEKLDMVKSDLQEYRGEKYFLEKLWCSPKSHCEEDDNSLAQANPMSDEADCLEKSAEMKMSFENMRLNRDQRRMIIDNPNESLGMLLGENPEGYYDYPLDLLPLSVRAYNCLKRAQVNTISNLLCKTYNDLIKVRNLGIKSANETIEKLVDFLSSNDNESSKIPADSSIAEKNPLTSMGIERLIDYLEGKEIKEENFTDKDKELFDKAKESAEVIGNEMALSYLNLSQENKIALRAALSEFSIPVLKKHEIKKVCENSLFKANKEIRNLPSGPIIDAFLFKNKNSLFYQYLKDVNPSTTIKELLSHDELFDLDKKRYRDMTGFFEYLCTDVMSFNKLMLDFYNTLMVNEQKVLVFRAMEFTLEEVGAELNVTRERVRQIEAKTNRKIIGFLGNVGYDFIAILF